MVYEVRECMGHAVVDENHGLSWLQNCIFAQVCVPGSTNQVFDILVLVIWSAFTPVLRSMVEVYFMIIWI
ncbi:hypothetical protein DL95DRAFT_393474 [Leptodontidium sp. 2 PMI_412]|nr:hypothetical protein DL95DRAFT_393474 [Leptodontidium sp. 2 PMI_412]